MKRKSKVIVSLMIILTMVMTCACGRESFVQDREEVMTTTAEFLVEKVKDAGSDTTGGDWTVIALAKSGAVENSDFNELFYDNVRAKVKSNKGVLHETKLTEYERTALALSAISKDALDVEGYNLMEKVDNLDKLEAQGINAETFALISSNVTGYKLDCEKKLLSSILSKQKPDGGFALSDGEAAFDITAMVVQGLSYYKDEKSVASVEKAVAYLGDNMAAIKDSSSESIAQIIIALSMVGVDIVTDERFILEEENLGDMLLQFRTGDGFSHLKGEEINVMATEHGLLALSAYKLFLDGEKLY